MINKNILKIASNTENFGIIDNCTHFSRLKNTPCGDQIKIYLVVKNQKISKFKYNGESCIYCQASASLLSKIAKNKSINNLKKFILESNQLFNKKGVIKNNWKSFSKIMNKKNLTRKECLLLPLRAVKKALEN